MTGKETWEYTKFIVGGLKRGQIAPDFTAVTADNKSFRLYEAVKVRPVLLEFGCNS